MSGVRFARIHGRVVPIGQKRARTAQRPMKRRVMKVAKKAGGHAAFSAGLALSTLGSIALGAGGILATDAALGMATSKGKFASAFSRSKGGLRAAMALGAVGAIASIAGSAISQKFRRHGGVLRHLSN